VLFMPVPSEQTLVLSPGRTPDAARRREQFALRAALSVSPAASPRSVLFYDAIQTAPSSPVGSRAGSPVGVGKLAPEPEQLQGHVPARPQAQESAQPHAHVPARPRTVAAAPFARAPAAHAPTASSSRARTASACAVAAAERVLALGAIARRRARILLLAGFRWWRLAVAVLRATELISRRSKAQRAQRAHVELGSGLLDLPRLPERRGA
jgi:hypothetical protein